LLVISGNAEGMSHKPDIPENWALTAPPTRKDSEK